MPNIIAFEADFHVRAQVSSLVRKSARAGWKKIVGIGRNGGVIDVDLEQRTDTARGVWSALSREGRQRDFCSKVSKEIADSVYRGGRYSGNWFIPDSSRGVRHAAWDLCEIPRQCDAAPWGHDSNLVPYPYLFLQTGSIGQDCVPHNRLSLGSGPGIWIAHFKGASIPDWKLIAAIGLNSEIFSALAVMGVSPMDNAVSNWGPWVPTESSICNGAEFIQRSFDLNTVRRPKNRKAIGSSLEDCEYGLPWFDEVYDIKNWELLVFDGRATVSALWDDEGNSALYLPVGENGANVFVG